MTNPSILGLISYKVFPAQMGGQKCVSEFYSHLANHTKVTLVVAKENGVPENSTIKVFPFLYNHWWAILNLLYLYKLTRLIKDQGIDIIFIEHSYFGWLGLLLRSLTKKPFVIRSHNIEALRFRDLQKNWWRLYEWYEKRIHRKADHNFFITEEDKAWAIRHWQLDEHKCSVATYSTTILQPMPNHERKLYRDQLLMQHKLNPGTKLFLFNGSLDYLPNQDALRIIISELLPILQTIRFDFRIFICGSRLSKQWIEVLRSYPNIIYLGFVDNIDSYWYGTDCFINPVTLGGGIKTKLIDALAHNQTAISTRNGASGISENTVSDKLILVNDYDWRTFAESMAELDIHQYKDTPADFYRQFNWDTIVQEALLSLQTL